jgi:hypothetical protein
MHSTAARSLQLPIKRCLAIVAFVPDNCCIFSLSLGCVAVNSNQIAALGLVGEEHAVIIAGEDELNDASTDELQISPSLTGIINASSQVFCAKMVAANNKVASSNNFFISMGDGFVRQYN